LGFLTAVIALFIILVFTLLVIRIATVALIFTGMSPDMARFQAFSAFSTVGFTTSEAESVVNHPVRRRIITMLMLAGNIGFVGIVVTALSSFEGSGRFTLAFRVLIILLTLGALWFIATSRWIDDQLSRSINWALKRWTRLESHDLLDLLQLGEGYSVTKLVLESGDWLIGKRLIELRLNNVGVNVLGIIRADGELVGSPVGSTFLRRGDELVVYGAREAILALDQNKSDLEQEEKHRQMLLEIQAQRERSGGGRIEGYCVTEVDVPAESWAVENRLEEARLSELGINVLGIHREDGEYIGSPVGATLIHANDRLVVYATRENVVALEHVMIDEKAAETLRQNMLARRKARRAEAEHKREEAAAEAEKLDQDIAPES
jgi:Trk K+ transport system NAD-binding subunit